MSRGSTDANGFPCPHCGTRSHVIASGRNGTGYKRKRKCTNPACAKPFWTVETIKAKPNKVSTRHMVRLFTAATPKHRGLLFRLLESWKEDPNGTP